MKKKEQATIRLSYYTYIHVKKTLIFSVVAFESLQTQKRNKRPYVRKWKEQGKERNIIYQATSTCLTRQDSREKKNKQRWDPFPLEQLF